MSSWGRKHTLVSPPPPPPPPPPPDKTLHTLQICVTGMSTCNHWYILHTHVGAVSLDQARDDISDSAFGTNPDPINYGLEAGDIVFAVFGSLLLVALAFVILLGFFIHPFFLA